MQSDNNQEMFPIVDEEGNITGAATRGECHSGSKLLHPVVHLHVFNSKGDLYLQKPSRMEGYPTGQVGYGRRWPCRLGRKRRNSTETRGSGRVRYYRFYTGTPDQLCF